MELNNAFKVLLLVEDARGHPGKLKVAHPDFKVIFLLPNTTSLIQLLDQGVISTFKTYYTCRTFHRILETMDADPELTVRQCWKEYNIANCIGTIE